MMVLPLRQLDLPAAECGSPSRRCTCLAAVSRSLFLLLAKHRIRLARLGKNNTRGIASPKTRENYIAHLALAFRFGRHATTSKPVALVNAEAAEIMRLVRLPQSASIPIELALHHRCRVVVFPKKPNDSTIGEHCTSPSVGVLQRPPKKRVPLHPSDRLLWIGYRGCGLSGVRPW
jgi:hypothetical protein